MQFETRIFVKVGNPGARVADLGGFLLFFSFLFGAVVLYYNLNASWYYFSLIGLGLGVIALIIGRIMTKGNMFDIGLSDTALVVADEGIGIGNKWYPIDQVADLDFMIEGYDGQPTIRLGRIFLRRRRRGLTGANNKIHFRAGGERYLYQFYLPDRLSMQQLGQVFWIYYERQVPFGECNRMGRTFLFRPIRSNRELQALRKSAGL